MGVVERIKEVVYIAPRKIGLDLLREVRLDSCIGLFVIVLSC
jgi:hypothetical protein